MAKHEIKVGIIGGSGLSDPDNMIFKYKSLISQKDAKNEFGLPSSSLYEGTISGINVVLLSRHGPGHTILPTDINYRANIEALRLAGCTHILASTACGSLSESIPIGQFVIPDSFIDRTVHRKGSFYDGTSNHYFGGCHVPMEPAFDPHTSKVLVAAANKLGIPVQIGGTIVTIEGPRYSSKAESNVFRQWGGHLVNMTTCPEVALAKEAGILYAAIAVATDYDCWRDSTDTVCAINVIAEFKKNVGKITQLLVQAVEMIGQEKWDDRIDDLNNVLKDNNLASFT